MNPALVASIVSFCAVPGGGAGVWSGVSPGTVLAPAATGVVARVPKVLIIGIDGCRADAVHTCATPSLHALMDEGCWSDRAHTGPLTCSGPGWSSVLCGVWMAKHNVKDNTFRGAAFDRWPHFFARLKEASPEFRVASFTSWLPIDGMTPGVTDVRFVHDRLDGGDELATAAAVTELSRGAVDAAFVSLADVDEAGHASGFSVKEPRYRAAMEATDVRIGRLLAAVRSRAAYEREDWLVLVTTDHGGTPDGSHGRDIPAHREIFYIASGPGAARGEIVDTVNQVDVVTTAMAHLGVAPSAGWDLDGRVRGLRSQKRLGLNLVDNGDAEAVEPAASREVNLGIPGWVDLGGMTTVAYGSGSEFPGAGSPGPRGRGRGLFAAGDKDSSIAQVIDVRDFATQIDAGGIEYELSAWLGGWSRRREMSRVSVSFLDAAGVSLGGARAGPQSEGTREQPPRLVERGARGRVPAGVRAIEVTLEVMVGQGECDGYADNVSLVLNAR